MSTSTNAPRTASRNRVAAIACVTALAAAAVAGGIAFVAGRDSAPTQSASSNSRPAGGGSHTVVPDNAIKTVQAELAELNFYEGPINGYDTAATVSAVENLQREAGLPQTGHMNDQTREALLRYLAQGDNVMNS